MWTAVERLLALLQYEVGGSDPVYLIECGLVFVAVAGVAFWVAAVAVKLGGTR